MIYKFETYNVLISRGSIFVYLQARNTSPHWLHKTSTEEEITGGVWLEKKNTNTSNNIESKEEHG